MSHRAIVELFEPAFTWDLLFFFRGSELLYNWWFSSIQFVSASSPLRLATRDLLFFQLSPCGNSPYVTSFLMRRFSLALPVWPAYMVLAQTLHCQSWLWRPLPSSGLGIVTRLPSHYHTADVANMSHYVCWSPLAVPLGELVWIPRELVPSLEVEHCLNWT
jgi:hypothetical protein